MRERLRQYLQDEFKFDRADTDKIIYGLEGLTSELSKLLIILCISFPFGYADEIIIATVILLSIRCNSGGLHFSHYISCLFFTSGFYMSVIVLSYFNLPQQVLAIGLILSVAVFSMIGPITSTMRPRLKPEEVTRYSHRVIYLLLLYSVLLITLESLPYRKIIYWVIVLQIFQLLCAKIARKGELYEKVFYAKDL